MTDKRPSSVPGAVPGAPVRRVVLASTATARGGVWRHLRELAGGLQERGIEVALALTPAAGELRQAAVDAGLQAIDLRASIRTPADIWHIHLHDTFDQRAGAAILARRPFGTVLITEHLPHTNGSDVALAPYFSRRPGVRHAKSAYKALQYAAAARVISVSGSSAAFIQARYLVPAAKVVVVHNGIEPAPAPAPPDPRGRPLRVLASGMMSWQKGFDLLLAAVAESAQPWTLELLGDGAQRPLLERQAATLPPERVRLRGWVEDPAALVRAADVVCMPSRWESFAYSALEAGAAARPLVGTDVDGLDEIIEPGRTGVLVVPESSAALAAALDRLALAPELVSAMGAAAAQHVRRYTLARMVDETVAVYASVGGDRHAR